MNNPKEIDEIIIKKGMEKFGLNRTEAIKQIKELVEMGFLKNGLKDFEITDKGITYVEEMIFQENDD